MTGHEPPPDVPPADELLRHAILTLQRHPGGMTKDALRAEVAVAAGRTSLLVGEPREVRVLERGVRYATEIAERAGLLTRDHDRVELTPTGLGAGDDEIGQAWRAELQRDDRSDLEKAMDRIFGFADPFPFHS
jgi:hypothetical protein